MSLKTLLQKIGQDISDIFKKTVNELETVILPAVTKVGNALKAVLDGDVTDIIGHLAGAAGAELEDKVRAAFDIIIPKLQLAQQFLSSGADNATILANIAKLISTAPAATQASFYIEFTGLLASDLAGGLTVAQAVQLEQWFYANDPSWSNTQKADPVQAPPTESNPTGPQPDPNNN